MVFHEILFQTLLKYVKKIQVWLKSDNLHEDLFYTVDSNMNVAPQHKRTLYCNSMATLLIFISCIIAEVIQAK
jgi:hypothetical protein